MNPRSSRPALPLIDEVFGLLPEALAPPSVSPRAASVQGAMGALSPLVQPSADESNEADVHLEPSTSPSVSAQPGESSAANLGEVAGEGLASSDSHALAPLPRKQGQSFRYSMPNLVYTPVELG